MGTIVGLLALGLGIAGFFIKKLPPVPFLFLAVICFMHFSPPFVSSLTGRQIKNSFFDDFIKERSMTRRNKIRTLAVGTVTGFLFFFLFETWIGKTITVVSLASMWFYIYFFVWTNIEDGHGCPNGIDCHDDDSAP